MKLIPLNDNLLIEKQDNPNEVTPSGLIVEETRNYNRLVRGKVVGKGSKVEYIEEDYIVIFKEQNSEPVEIQGKTLYLVPEEYILGFIE